MNLSPKSGDPRWFLREQIKKQLTSLVVPAGQILKATLKTAHRGNWDVENVLFLNVGGDFARLARNGISFEVAPPLQDVEYTYRYEFTEPNDAMSAYVRRDTLARWERVALTCIPKRAATVWRDLCDARGRIQVRKPSEPVKRFGVAIRLHCPQTGYRASNYQLLKPLLDGVLSAFHFDRGSTDGAVALHGDICGLALQKVREYLSDDRFNLLGYHRLFDGRAQMSPLDNGCLFASLLGLADGGGQLLMSGEIFALEDVLLAASG